MRLLYPILFFLCLVSAHADTLHGTVTGIADGDTLYVTDPNRHTHKIRLLGIDAPEHGQAYGEVSRQALKQLAHRQPVQVEWRHRDQYGRLLGKVMLPGSRDANLYQLSIGMAWWNRKYAYEQTDADAIHYREAEYVARKKRLGLWSQKNPVPPWRWRYANPREVDKVKP
jgi:endonuclease YncB( thermonuclease family)